VKIPLNVCTYGQEEIDAATAVLKSTYVTMGENCREFEKEFAAKLGAKEAVLVNSGSSANLLAWFALANPTYTKFPNHWEVIVPAVSWATTYWPIVQAGGVPVLVDVDPRTLQMRTDQLESALTSKTVAVCPVHVLGNAVNMREVTRFANEHGLVVVEDTCEALGTRFGSRYVGTVGDIGTYSFFFSHHITSIEGGMVVTNDAYTADVMRMMRAHGWSRDSQFDWGMFNPDLDPSFLFITTGFNLRNTEVNAAIGRIQLRKLDAFNERRKKIFEYWNKELANSRLFDYMKVTSGTDAAPFGYPVVCENKETRNELKKHLNRNGIETRPIVSGNITRHPAVKNLGFRAAASLIGADVITDRGLLWPLHPRLTDDEVEYILGVVKDVL
jgi:CDP-6-deoxy-D-xylo-4-hexulose-3-dehydrase